MPSSTGPSFLQKNSYSQIYPDFVNCSTLIQRAKGKKKRKKRLAKKHTPFNVFVIFRVLTVIKTNLESDIVSV